MMWGVIRTRLLPTDIGFAVLRLITFMGGLGWLIFSNLRPLDRFNIALILALFCAYSSLLYLFILSWPKIIVVADLKLPKMDGMELLKHVKEKYQALAKENILLHNQLDERYGIDNIIGKNKRMQEIYELIKTIAPGKSNVVIYGEQENLERIYTTG